MSRPDTPQNQRQHDECIVSGIHTVSATLASGRIRRLWIDDIKNNQRLRTLSDQAQQQGIPVKRLSRQGMDELAGDDMHQGVVAVVSLPTADLTDVLQSPDKPLVVLDGVTDPRNLGAIIRVARAFAAAAVIVPKRRSAPLSTSACRASSGAVATMPVIRVVNINRALRTIQDAGWSVAGAAEEGEWPLFGQPLPPPVCWVLGDEGIGLRHLTRRHCDYLVRIPTVADETGCLNVSTACAICLAVSTNHA